MTDGRTRAGCWSVTAFDAEIDMVQDQSNWPSFVSSVAGGKEKCPKTDKIHFQGCVVLNTTQRLGAMKKWLPKAHWEPARSKEALKKYAMKTETSVGEKKVLGSDPDKKSAYLRPDQCMELLAKVAYDMYLSLGTEYEVDFWINHWPSGDIIDDYRFLELTRKIISEDHAFINFCDSKLRSHWVKYHMVFIKARISSITDSPCASHEDSDIENLD